MEIQNQKAPRVDLVYGHSLKGKSRNIAELVKHKWLTEGKKSRLYIGDGGISTYLNLGLVEAGILEICDFGSRVFPFVVLRAMSEFYWPNEAGKWEAPTKEFLEGEEYGLVIFEGATIMKNWLLSNTEGGVAYRVAHGEQIGGAKDSAGNLQLTDGRVSGVDEEFSRHGQLSGLHYKMPYDHLRAAIARTEKFKGKVIWTAHPIEAPDFQEGGKSGKHGEILGKKVIGPDICGKAGASTITALFGNTLHCDTATKIAKEKDEQGKQIRLIEPEYRLYTRTHFDPDGNELTEYLAASRSDNMPLYFTGDGEPGRALVDFYDQEAKQQRERAQLIEQLKQNKETS